jgi:hypothetical protein
MRYIAAQALLEAERARQAAEARRRAELERQRQIAAAADKNFQQGVKNAAADANLTQAVQSTPTAPIDLVELGGGSQPAAPELDLLKIYETHMQHMQEDLEGDAEEAPPAYLGAFMKAKIDIDRLKQNPDGAAALIERYEKFFNLVKELPPVGDHIVAPGPTGAMVRIPVAIATQAATPQRPSQPAPAQPVPASAEPDTEIEIVGAGSTKARQA